MKKAIALFMTLMFLAVAVVFIDYIMSSYQKITQKSSLFISQNSLIIKSSLTTLKNLKIKNESDLKKIFTSFPVSSKDGSFRALIEIKPVNSINLNDYLKNGEINSSIDLFFDYLLFKYDVKDPVFFKNLVLDTLDRDDIQRSADSEIMEYDPLFQNGKIYNFFQFKKILKYYAQKTLDKSITKIPWKDFFNFRKSQIYLPNATISEFLEQNVTRFNIISFKKAKKFFVTVTVKYDYETAQSIKILYDIKNKKVADIEIDPVY